MQPDQFDSQIIRTKTIYEMMPSKKNEIIRIRNHKKHHKC